MIISFLMEEFHLNMFIWNWSDWIYFTIFLTKILLYLFTQISVLQI